MDWAVWPLLLLSILAFECCKGCQVENCTENFGMSLREKDIADAEPTKTYCDILRAYGQCISQTEKKSCHGDLSYHSVVLIHRRLNDNYCSGNRRNNSNGSRKNQSRTTSTEASNTKSPVSCAYRGKHRFHFCGLFGDPHLKTFMNEYQTCQIDGAWPLIDNPYFAVQVTNKRVQEGFPATAPTKITIIIRGSSTLCTSEKTYEAQSDSPSLPSTFTDDAGPNTGVDKNVILSYNEESEDGHQRVEIFLRYIETTLVIRKVGKYLAFSAKIPQEITKDSINSESNGELCSKGCPKKDRMNIISERGHFVTREEALEKCKKMDNLSNDIANTLTDEYLDWCIFDVMTAGMNAANDFVIAAHSAQADVLRFDPQSLKNRTTLLETDSTQYSSAPSLLRIHMLTVSFLFTILYLFSQRLVSS